MLIVSMLICPCPLEACWMEEILPHLFNPSDSLQCHLGLFTAIPSSVRIKSECFPFCDHLSENSQLHSNTISWRRSHFVIVIINLPQPPVMTLSSLAPSLRKPTDRVPTKEVLFPDFPECCAEFLDAESVNDGVDGWVAVAEDDGDVNEKHLLAAGRTEEGDAVEDVEGKPADCEEEQNQGEGLGQLQLLAKVTPRVCVACAHLQRQKAGASLHLHLLS